MLRAVLMHEPASVILLQHSPSPTGWCGPPPESEGPTSTQLSSIWLNYIRTTWLLCSPQFILDIIITIMLNISRAGLLFYCINIDVCPNFSCSGRLSAGSWLSQITCCTKHLEEQPGPSDRGGIGLIIGLIRPAQTLMEFRQDMKSSSVLFVSADPRSASIRWQQSLPPCPSWTNIIQDVLLKLLDFLLPLQPTSTLLLLYMLCLPMYAHEEQK